VHRDLKPSNILIMVQSGKPIPKIIDFGIAKAMGRSLTDRTLVTAIGLPIGTPAYMSPEQAEMSGLDIDTRADIYTLGVILYELLSGTLPFDSSTISADFAAFQRRMRETDPPVPSVRMSVLGEKLPSVAELRHATPASLKRQLQGDLDWIIMKAMEKDRTRRYETVNALILEIRRHLNDEPVLARAPTLGYRAAKFVKRYKGWVAAAALAVSSLGVGLGAATYQWRQAEVQRSRALQNLNMAIEAVDQMLLAVGDTLALASAPVLEEIREDLFAKARSFYEQFRAQTTEPEYRLATAMASQRLGDVYGLTGQVREAEAAYLQAIDSLEVLAEQYPERARYQHHLADGHNWLGLQLAQRDPARARAAYTALALQEALTAKAPEEPEYRYHLARTLYNRGILLATDTATVADAERDYRAAIGHLDALVREDRDPEAPLASYRQELARSYNNLGKLLRDTGRQDEAWVYFERAVDILEDLSRSEDKRAYKQELAIYNNNLAVLLLEGQEPDRAATRSRRALELFEELAAPTARWAGFSWISTARRRPSPPFAAPSRSGNAWRVVSTSCRVTRCLSTASDSRSSTWRCCSWIPATPTGRAHSSHVRWTTTPLR
jgi:tetratricopeptide (TPR) repeat protein